jgi:chromosome segregation ATPase
LRDDIDAAMESLFNDFEKNITEIGENAQQWKKEAWNSGQRVNERKVEGLEKQTRDLEEELKDTQDKLKVKIWELKDVDEVLMSID